MSDPCDVINIRAEVISTGAESVGYCEKCGCPVVNADGAMDRHRLKIHVPPAAAKAGVNVQRWAREW